MRAESWTINAPPPWELKVDDRDPNYVGPWEVAYEARLQDGTELECWAGDLLGDLRLTGEREPKIAVAGLYWDPQDPHGWGNDHFFTQEDLYTPTHRVAAQHTKWTREALGRCFAMARRRWPELRG